jgi:3-hydroxybutyryl-CoA dehydratase
MLSSLLWQSLQTTLGDERMAGAAMDIRFVRPVREDDLVIAGGQRAEHAAQVQAAIADAGDHNP